MKERLRKYPVLLRWLASYLVILIVPLLLSIAIYFFARRIIFRASEEIYAATLEQARNEVDSQLTVLDQVLNHITVSNNVQILNFIRDELSPSDYFAIYRLVNELKNYQVIYPLLDDTLVVLNQTGTVAGRYGHMSLDMFFDLFLSGSGLGREEFTGVMREPGRKRNYKTPDKLFFLQGAPSGNLGINSVTVALIIRDSLFSNQFLKNFAANGSILYITDSEGRIISTTTEKEKLPLLEELIIDGKGTVRLNNVQYRTLQNRSEITDWNFHYLIPMDLQGQKARQIQFFTLGGFLLCSLFGLFFSIRMSRRNYGEYRNIEISLEDKTRILRKYYLYTMLERPFNGAKDPDDMKLYSIQFPGDCFLVILFILPQGQQSRVNPVFIKIFQELAGRHVVTELTDVGWNIAAIVNWPDRDGNNGEIAGLLEDDIEETQRRIGERFNLAVSAVLSDPHRGPEGIYYSNLEAREALQYLDANNGEAILHYKDIRYSGDSYHYPLEIEQNLINLIRLGNDEKALGLIRQVFEDNISRTGVSGQIIKLLASDLMGTLMKGRLTPETKLMPEILFSTELSGGIPHPERLIDYLEKKLDEICRANRSFLDKKHSHELGEKIKTYINENFRNPDLNISITALHFDLTPAYLSGIFQQQTGLNLLEYISTLRIEESKKLLEQGYSITKTAELAGFRGSSTFIRIFRKITGVTPGQYKDIG
ncbi:MAG: helix-turn-helix domain-containing protein [Treponema sp.]|jgi:AraC-like DNA-binding protein|nr:helix-turn-helix domain-containing protein [Treponema sp.]